MTELPSTIVINEVTWELREIDRVPAYISREHPGPCGPEEMQPKLQIAGWEFRPAYRSALYPGWHYAAQLRGGRKWAYELLSCRSRLYEGGKIQRHISKMVCDARDDDEMDAFVEAFFLLERDLNWNRDRARLARDQLFKLHTERCDVNRLRPKEQHITDHEQAVVVNQSDEFVNSWCGDDAERREKRQAIAANELRREARSRSASVQLRDAGLTGGVAVHGRLDHEPSEFRRR